MMQEELIDVLDEDGNKTGKVKPKSQIKKDGDFYKGVLLCIVNDKKEILMNRRTSNKIIYPNMWSCFITGHVVSSEEVVDACLRELKEELGVSVEKEEIKFLYTSKDNNSSGTKKYINNIFREHYLLIKNVDLKDIVMQKEEVSEVKYMHYKEIEELVKRKDEKLIPNFDEYEKIFPLIDKL